jgi:hypothetical protein
VSTLACMEYPRWVSALQRRLTLACALLLLTSLMCWPGISRAQTAASIAPAERVALVIGNSSYRSVPLLNPRNDAEAMADLLRQAGFSVDAQFDTSQQQLASAVERFGKVIRDPKVKFGLFYYAGHGLQLEWRNYLVPVSADIQSPDDVRKQTIDVSYLLKYMEEAQGRNFLVILDACRDDPFGDAFRPPAKGLSQFDAPAGSMLAYATAPGSVAMDGTGRNGLYTSNLLREFSVRGARIEDAFKRVRLNVRLASQGRQIPWESTSLEEDVYLFPTDRKKLSETEQDELLEREIRSWLSVKGTNDVQQLANFVREFPSGNASELAQARLNRLLMAQASREQAELEAARQRIAEGQGKRLPLPFPDVQVASRNAAQAAELERQRELERQAEQDRLREQEQARSRERERVAAVEAAAAADRVAAAQRQAEQDRLREQEQARARERERLAAAEAAAAADRIAAAERQAAIERERMREQEQAQARERERIAQAERVAAAEREAAAARERLNEEQQAQARERARLAAAERAAAAERQAAAERRAAAERLAAAERQAAQERDAAAAQQAEAQRQAALEQAAAAEQQAALERVAAAERQAAVERQVAAARQAAEAEKQAALARQAAAEREAAQAKAAAVPPLVPLPAPAPAPAPIVVAALPATPFYKGYSEHQRNYKVGDLFRFDVIDGLTKVGKPLELRVTAVDLDADRVEYNGGQFVSDTMGNTMATQRGSFTTPRQFYPAELYVGKRWHTAFKQARPNGVSYTYRYDVRVVGKETITVPAGTFEAFKIEARGFNVQLGAALARNIWVTPGVPADIAHETIVRLRNGAIEQFDRQELVSIGPRAGG